MRHEGNNVFLDKGDLIRMNQLVRRQTDYGRFWDWYQALIMDEQAALIGELCHFAYQAGVDDTVFQIAAEQAGLTEEQDFLAVMKKVRGSSGLNIGGFVQWLQSASESDRVRAFKFFVHLFGEAERKALRQEDSKDCNHWWHRNLDDPRVVESILNDREYFKTSPRDDNPPRN
jgi:hypothetical protein